MTTNKKILERPGTVPLVAVWLSALCGALSADAQEMTNPPRNHGQVDVKLFLGGGSNQPLIVGFGGSEGGNAFAEEFAKSAVDGYIAEGYAFLALGYFGLPGTPAELDRIALDGVHEAIMAAAEEPKINERCIAVLGGSKGAELALVLASYYPQIKAVVGIVPGNAVFAALTSTMSTSSWSLDGHPLAFVPVPESAAPFLLPPETRNLRLAWEEMLKDEEAVERAAIAVERINGPILLVSATRDEYWALFRDVRGDREATECERFSL